MMMERVLNFFKIKVLKNNFKKLCSVNITSTFALRFETGYKNRNKYYKVYIKVL